MCKGAYGAIGAYVGFTLGGRTVKRSFISLFTSSVNFVSVVRACGSVGSAGILSAVIAIASGVLGTCVTTLRGLAAIRGISLPIT